MSQSYIWTDYAVKQWPALRDKYRLRPCTQTVWMTMANSTEGAAGDDFGRCLFKGQDSLAKRTVLSLQSVRRALGQL